MSSMLEKAIVDATALREAAIKSAEQSLIEKFSTNIKEAVDTILDSDEILLEQEEVQEGNPESDPKVDEDMTHLKELNDQLDEEKHNGYAFMQDASVSDAETIDLKFEKIISEVKRMEQEGILEAEEDVVEEEELVEVDLDSLEEDMGETPTPKPSDEEVKPSDEEVEASAEEDSLEAELTGLEGMTQEQIEEAISAILQEENLEETVKFDYTPTKAGWLNYPESLRSVEKMAGEVSDMFERHNEKLEEENAKLKNENKQLKKKNQELLAKLNESKGNEEKLTEALDFVKNKFDEVQTLNSKLFYTNKVMMDDSLNERQKGNLVESINGAESADRAKMIYETLQSGVDTSNNRRSESLSEVVSEHSSTSILLKSKKAEKLNENKVDSFASRMRILAGITDNN